MLRREFMGMVGLLLGGSVAAQKEEKDDGAGPSSYFHYYAETTGDFVFVVPEEAVAGRMNVHNGSYDPMHLETSKGRRLGKIEPGHTVVYERGQMLVNEFDVQT